MRMKLFLSFVFVALISCVTKIPDHYETEVSLLQKTEYGIVALKSAG